MKQILLFGIVAGVMALALACKSTSGNQAQISRDIQALNDKDTGVRWKAIGKLSKYQQDAVPALITALQDTNPDVRWCAAGSLALIGTSAKDALPKLLKLVSDDMDVAVREMAQLAANQIGGDNAARRPAKVNLTTSTSPGDVTLSVPSEIMLQRLRAEVNQPERKE